MWFFQPTEAVAIIASNASTPKPLVAKLGTLKVKGTGILRVKTSTGFVQIYP